MRHGTLQWKDVLERLQQLSPEELEDSATIHTPALDEFYGVLEFRVIKEGDDNSDVLDAGHLYLEMNE